MNTQSDIQCREAIVRDAETISDFNSRLALETELLILDADTVRDGVARGLQLAPEVRYFVAECAGRVIGQVMITREWSDWRNGWMIWLQSVYVVQDFRQRGVFRRLFDLVQQHVTARDGAVGIRLYVEHDNTAAQETYARLGFRVSGYGVMELSFQ